MGMNKSKIKIGVWERLMRFQELNLSKSEWARKEFFGFLDALMEGFC